MDKIKSDQTFFTLRSWNDNPTERDLIKKIYSTNLLTPRERRTLAVYHSATYLRLHSYKKHYQAIILDLQTLSNGQLEESFLIELENNFSSAIRSAWNIFDSLAHEINLVLWKVSNRKELFHPYIKEKKISFYMVRERLLASDKLQDNKLSRLLAVQTRDPDLRSNEYVSLSELASRTLHRPILLAHRLVFSEGKELPEIFLSDVEGMPADSSSSLQDFELVSGLTKIGEWLNFFVDKVYLALSECL
jgi:hypothetical protein